MSPVRPTVTTPAHLHVTGAPDIAVDPASLAFGTVFVGFPVTRELTLVNEGTDVLHVGAITIDDPAYAVSESSFDIPIRESRVVEVTLSSLSAAGHDATLSIVSDDADEALVTVPVTGRSKGKTTWRKARSGVQPSSTAASS